MILPDLNRRHMEELISLSSLSRRTRDFTAEKLKPLFSLVFEGSTSDDKRLFTELKFFALLYKLNAFRCKD